MKVSFKYEGETFDVGWGFNLVGSAPECELRVEPSSGLPPEAPRVAGVVVRWNDVLRVVGFGGTLGLRDFRGSNSAFPIPLGESGGQRGIAFDQRAIALSLWGQSAQLSWEPPQSTWVLQPSGTADLLRVFHQAQALDVDDDERLAGLIGSILGTVDVRSVPESSPDSVVVRSQVGAFRPRTLIFDSAPQSARRGPVDRAARTALLPEMGTAAGEVSACLDQVLPDLAEASSDIQPAAAPAVLHVPQQTFSVQGCETISARRLAHLDKGYPDTGAPALLVGSVDGQLQVVAPGQRPCLKSDAELRWRLRLAEGEPFTVQTPRSEFQAKVKVRAGRHFTVDRLVARHFSDWGPPRFQAMRLGLIDAALEARRLRAQGYLAFLLNSTRAHGGWILGPRGKDRTGLCLTRCANRGVEQPGWPLPRIFEVLEALAEGQEDPLEVADLYLDDRVAAAANDGELVGEVLDVGPIMVVQVGRYSALLWRRAGTRAFLGEDREALKMVGRLLARASGEIRLKSCARRVPSAPPTQLLGELRFGHACIPLGPITTLGSAKESDGWIGYNSLVSRRHAGIVCDSEGLRVLDLRSLNGVFRLGKGVKDARLSLVDTLNLAGTEVHLQVTSLLGKSVGAGIVMDAAWGLPSLRDRTEALQLMSWGKSLALRTPPPDLHGVRGALEVLEELERTDGVERSRTGIAGREGPRLQHENEVVSLDRLRWVGRSQACDLRLPDETVSRRHAVVGPTADGGVWFLDNTSDSGTWLDGVRRTHGQLAPGDELKIGAQRVRFFEGTVRSPSRDVADRVAAVRLGEGMISTIALGEALSTEYKVSHLVLLRLTEKVTPVVSLATWREPFWQAEDLLGEPGLKSEIAAIRGVGKPSVVPLLRRDFQQKYVGTLTMDESMKPSSVLMLPLTVASGGDWMLMLASRDTAEVAFRKGQLPAFYALGSMLAEQGPPED